MPQMQARFGRRITRTVEPLPMLNPLRGEVGDLAVAFAYAHNEAVQRFGSNCGGFHAFNPNTRASEGVWDGTDGFPRDTVVTRLSWGRIGARTAQRLLEGDGIDTDETKD